MADRTGKNQEVDRDEVPSATTEGLTTVSSRRDSLMKAVERSPYPLPILTPLVLVVIVVVIIVALTQDGASTSPETLPPNQRPETEEQPGTSPGSGTLRGRAPKPISISAKPWGTRC